MIKIKGGQTVTADRRWSLSCLLFGGLVVAAFAATTAWAENIHGKLRGVVTVSGGSLTLPLAPTASNVIITLHLGGASGPSVPITVTPSTKIEAEDVHEKEGVSGSITLKDGDPIRVRGKLQGSELVATTLELEEFPEIELFGVVGGLSGSLTLPLALGAPNVTITLQLGGTGGPSVQVVITPSTRVRGGTTLTLINGDFTQVKAVLQGSNIFAVKIGKEMESEVEHDGE